MYIILIENENLNYFNNVHSFLINNNFILSTSNSFLEIIVNDSIYKITDELQIKNYRKTNIIPHNDFITKYNIITENEEVNEQYDYNVTIKEETIEYIKMDDDDDNIKDLVKQFRMKKELIYKKKDNHKLYYRCEVITEGLEINENFKNITFNTKSPKYVYSVISNEKLDHDYHIRELHFMLDNNIIPLKKEEQQNSLNNYKKLIESIFTQNVIKKDFPDNIVMIAPKPATLEKHNLASIEEYGVTSIFENYAVTEKADGDRFLLYIDNESKSYLIETSSKQVRGCTITTNAKNCLLDGELVLCQNRLKNNTKDLFAIFDIYYYENKAVYIHPLLDDNKTISRYDYMKKFLESIKYKHSHDITIKQQLTSDNILNNCNEILSNTDTYDYHIDGLIFTPIKIPVFSSYANKSVQLNNINNLSWNKVLKWKPPDQNTIDFIVIEKGISKLSSDGKTYKEYSLNVVFNNLDMEPISVKNGLNYIYRGIKRSTENTYTLKQFDLDGLQTVYIETDINNRCFTKDKHEILNHSVVEFAYDNITELLAKQKRWIPLRIRHDKNKVYNFGEGEINKTANSHFVAMNIWRSITNEVSTDMICGKQDININIKKYLTGLDVYYKRSIPSFNLISNKMNQFHNHIIKADLYKVDVKSNSSKQKSLLELACGQASDLNRWIDNNFTNVLGIDYTLDNITNAKAGAYSRFLNSKNKTKYLTMLFVAGDCSKSIRNGKASEGIDDNESKELLKYIFNNKGPSEFNFIKFFPKTFDVVSCMFSVHYFFENEDMLDGFIRNVAENIAENGKFILTFMDNINVKKILKPNDKAIGKDIQTGAVVWAIKRNYNIHQTSPYNQKIDVFIENTGRLISENLVDLNILISKLSKYKIILSETETFEETFNKKKASLTIDKLNYQQKGQKSILDTLDTDNNLKTFSFLNRWCIFTKTI